MEVKEKADFKVLLPGIPLTSSRGWLGWSTVALLRLKGVTIVIDTGGFNSRALLLDSLKEYGLDPSLANIVFLSHLHFDHCMNLDLFDKATIIVGARELDYALSNSPEERGDIFVPKTYIRGILRDMDVKKVKEGDEIAPGVTVLELPGHTPGSVGLFIKQLGISVVGDAIKNSREFTNRCPDLCFSSLELWNKSVGKIISLSKVILPGHDRLFKITGDKSFEYEAKPTVIDLNIVLENAEEKRYKFSQAIGFRRLQ